MRTDDWKVAKPKRESKTAKAAKTAKAIEAAPFSPILAMAAWEEGKLDSEGTAELFGYLVREGMIAGLPDKYKEEAAKQAQQSAQAAQGKEEGE